MELHKLGRQVSHKHGQIVRGEVSDNVEQIPELTLAARTAAHVDLHIARIHDVAHEPEEVETHHRLFVVQPLANTGVHGLFRQRCRDGRAQADDLEEWLQQVGIKCVVLAGFVKAADDGVGEISPK